MNTPEIELSLTREAQRRGATGHEATSTRSYIWVLHKFVGFATKNSCYYFFYINLQLTFACFFLNLEMITRQIFLGFAFVWNYFFLLYFSLTFYFTSETNLEWAYFLLHNGIATFSPSNHSIFLFFFHLRLSNNNLTLPHGVLLAFSIFPDSLPLHTRKLFYLKS